MKRFDNDDIEDICRGILMGKTIRQIAEQYDVSKSTIHLWVHKYALEVCGSRVYYEVLDQLKYNFNQKAIRGGQANSKKWQEVRNDRKQAGTT